MIQNIRDFRETLRKLERQLDAQLKEDVQCCGVSLVQCHTILELGKQEQINLTALSTSLQLDKSTVSRGIDTLMKQELVSRETDPNNRRSVLLSLTPKGKKTCDSINQFCDNYYKNVFRHIPGEKQEQVMESLALFAEALAASKGSPNTCAIDITNLTTNTGSTGKENINGK
ncbi:MAG: MarR family transcriptional regulator [bacterium]|nr:MarR family transcriptional regulator [bacterium]